MDYEDAWDLVLALPGLTTSVWKTPGSGGTARPFRVARAGDEGLVVSTSKGGRVPLRPEAFRAGAKALEDLGGGSADGWVPVSDDALQAILAGENREHACSSYVLPLLEAAGLVELDRTRPAKARARRPASGA